MSCSPHGCATYGYGRFEPAPPSTDMPAHCARDREHVFLMCYIGRTHRESTTPAIGSVNAGKGVRHANEPTHGLQLSQIGNSVPISPIAQFTTQQIKVSAGISVEGGAGSIRPYPYVAHPWGYTTCYLYDSENTFTPSSHHW